MAAVRPHRAGPAGAAPDTLVKLVRRAGPERVAQLNSALLDKLAQDKLLRGRKLRADTTVVEADIDYPPMPGCWPMRWQAGWAGAARQGPGSGQPDPVPDRGRVAGRRMGKLGQTLRRRSGEAMAEVQRVTAELAGLARQTLGQVQPVWRNARRALRRRPQDGRLARLVGELDETMTHTQRLLARPASGCRVSG